MGEWEGKIAYIIGVFPSLTETFIVREVLELRRRGLSIVLFSLTTPREKVVHPEAQALRQETTYSPFFLSWDLWKAQLYFLWRSPGAYLSLWWDVARYSFREPWVLVRSWAAIPKSVRFARIVERSDVTHLHGHMCTFGALGAMIMSRLTGIPYSFTAHGLRVYSGNPMLPEKARRASFVVCVSRFIQRFIKSLCPEISLERLVVRHYGVDLEIYHPRAVPPANPKPIILCVAGLKPWKGVRDLVHAVNILRQDGFSLECWHVGEGPEEGRIRAQATRLGLEGFFLMKGPMTQAELVPLYGKADIFVLPSRIEGLPVSLMEAMACGLPAVASNIYGVPEMIDEGKSGLLVPPGDPPALARALGRLIDDPLLRRKLGEAAREVVEQGFDIRRNTDELASLFRERVGKASGGPQAG